MEKKRELEQLDESTFNDEVQEELQECKKNSDCRDDGKSFGSQYDSKDTGTSKSGSLFKSQLSSISVPEFR